MYEVLVSDEAGKYYKRLDKNTKQRINKCMEIIGNNPLYGSNIKKLHGELESKYRYALSNLRIVYTIDIEAKKVKVKAIGTRDDIYK